MPTPAQKKNASKRGGAVRDITVKRITRDMDDDFNVHHIHDDSNDSPAVEPLITTQSIRKEKQSVEAEMEDVLAGMDDDQPSDRFPLEPEPKDVVKVNFAKFVQLVSSRDCADVVGANPDEQVVLSSNLLAELAGAHDEREEKKIPLVFLVGLAIGVVVTYILFMK